LAWINARCPPKLLCHSSCSAGQGKENMKGSRVETRTGRDHLPITVTDKQTELGQKREFDLPPIKSEQHNEN